MQTQTEKSARQTTDNLREQCIQNCNKSLTACLEGINFCLEQGGDHLEKEHLKILQSCAIACRTSVELMSLQSDFSASFCKACAEVCQACAESCEKMDGAPMKMCAEACRGSQQSCEKMAQAH